MLGGSIPHLSSLHQRSHFLSASKKEPVFFVLYLYRKTQSFMATTYFIHVRSQMLPYGNNLFQASLWWCEQSACSQPWLPTHTKVHICKTRIGRRSKHAYTHRDPQHFALCTEEKCIYLLQPLLVKEVGKNSTSHTLRVFSA